MRIYELKEQASPHKEHHLRKIRKKTQKVRVAKRQNNLAPSSHLKQITPDYPNLLNSFKEPGKYLNQASES